MAFARATNVQTSQMSATTTAFVQIDTRYSTTVNIHVAEQDCWLYSGHKALADVLDTDCYRMPKGSALEVKPVPTGALYVKSIGADQTVYLLGS